MPGVKFEHARRICWASGWREPRWKVPKFCDPSFPPTDNLWSVYTDKGVFVEKQGTPSVPVPEESRSSKLPYVLTDIMTYFTMLVGIYFPSVTGEAAGTPAGQAGSSLSSNVANPVPLPRPVFFPVWLKKGVAVCSPSVLSGERRKPGGFRQLCSALS